MCKVRMRVKCRIMLSWAVLVYAFTYDGKATYTGLCSSRLPLKIRCTCLISWCLAPWPFGMDSPPSWWIKKYWRWPPWTRDTGLSWWTWLLAGLFPPTGPSWLQRNSWLSDWSVWSKDNQRLWHTGTRVWGRLRDPLCGFSCFSGVFLHSTKSACV